MANTTMVLSDGQRRWIRYALALVIIELEIKLAADPSEDNEVDLVNDLHGLRGLRKRFE